MWPELGLHFHRQVARRTFERKHGLLFGIRVSAPLKEREFKRQGRLNVMFFPRFGSLYSNATLCRIRLGRLDHSMRTDRPNRSTGRRPPGFLAEQFRLLVRDSVPHDIVRCPRELIRQRPMGNRLFLFMYLPVIEVPACGIKPASMIRSFRESPREIPVPVFPVTLSLHLLAALPDALGFTAVRDIVTDRREAADVSGLQQDT